VAAVFATVAASGADASGYLSEAKLLAEGRLVYRDTLASIVGGWQSGLTSPLGWRPGALEGWQSPTYPPGLPLLMAIPHWAGGSKAAALVVAASAAIAVWSTGMIASRLSGVAAIVAAVTLATLPVFIFQSIQPMSDVPVTAAWMVCWLILIGPGAGQQPRRTVFFTGLACAIAVLIRPNLAPLAIVPLILVGRRLRDATAFALPVALAGLALMWAQWQWYGSPLRSGYGTPGEIFALANIRPNARFYVGVLVSTAPILLLAPIGAWLVRRDRRAWALVAFAALVVAAYLVYAVFEDWSYFRFLLPALAIGSIFVGAAVARMVAGVPASARAAVAFTVALAIAAVGIANARVLDAFALKEQHHRIVQLGEHLSASIPAGAVVVSGEQSGAMRYYTGRPIVRWDAASPEDLLRALAALEAANRPVWFVLDAWEEEPFRAKFAGVPPAALDWPPAVTAGTTHRTSAWQLSDRERFSRGESPQTLRIP
jgi:4-amino-4-deoxy-L-arabinose transferase-like glycosyltransferase